MNPFVHEGMLFCKYTSADPKKELGKQLFYQKYEVGYLRSDL